MMMMMMMIMMMIMTIIYILPKAWRYGNRSLRLRASWRETPKRRAQVNTSRSGGGRKRSCRYCLHRCSLSC